jgi:hypothetical protein
MMKTFLTQEEAQRHVAELRKTAAVSGSVVVVMVTQEKPA